MEMMANDTEEYSYFELDGFGIGDDGKPCPAGLKINIIFKADTPEKIREGIIADMLKIKRNRVHVITERDYLEKYDDSDEEV